MKDLGFIKNCNNCKHNISFTEKDIEKEYFPLGYIIVYKPMGECRKRSMLCEKAEILAQYINELMSPPMYSNCSCSGVKIHKILKVFKYKHYITCPNCKEKILLEEGTFETSSRCHGGMVMYGWSGWYKSSLFKDSIWYKVEYNGGHNL